MTQHLSVALLAAAGLALCACGRDQAPTPKTAPGTTPPTLVEQARQAVKEAGQAAEAQLRTATGDLLEKGRGLSDSAGAKAALLIPQIKDAIAANQPELARTLLARLESVKGALPEALKGEVARLAALLAGTQQALTPAAGQGTSAPPPVPAIHHPPAAPPITR